MSEYPQEDNMFMYFNIYLQGGDVPPEMRAEFEAFELANTSLPEEPLSDDSQM